MGTSLKGENLLPESGSEFFPLREVSYDVGNDITKLRDFLKMLTNLIRKYVTA